MGDTHRELLRKYAASQGIAEETPLKQAMEGKFCAFTATGAEVHPTA